MQVQLFDKPAEAMSQRMADAIWAKTLPYAAATAALGAATLAAAASQVATPFLGVGALTALGLGLLPVVRPLLEVQQLSRLSREQIEAAVDPKQALQV